MFPPLWDFTCRWVSPLVWELFTTGLAERFLSQEWSSLSSLLKQRTDRWGRKEEVCFTPRPVGGALKKAEKPVSLVGHIPIHQGFFADFCRRVTKGLTEPQYNVAFVLPRTEITQRHGRCEKSMISRHVLF